jgi:hypothetical protein
LLKFPLGFDPFIVDALLGALGFASMAEFTRREFSLHAGDLQALAGFIRGL